MFDTAKVQIMTEGLIRFSQEHDNVYVLPEFLEETPWALFRRLKIQIRAVLFDVPSHDEAKRLKKISGLPVLKTSEATTNFNERTGIIVLRNKKTPFIKTGLDFTINGRLTGLPAFVMDFAEASAIYDRLTIANILQQYREDGLTMSANLMAERFARGLTTFLDPNTQNVKIQFWDRNYFVAPKYEVGDTAIVLRGQIVHENHYTEKTIEFYRSVYPNAPIIVSTWKNELTDNFRSVCKKFSVILLENIQTKVEGFGNFNYQLQNAFEGVKYVKENLDARFILITRTDQRLNKFDFLLYFRNMIQTFPPLGDKLQNRILMLGTWITKKYIPFQITDFLVFGHVADIFKFCDIPYLNDKKEFSFRIAHEKIFFYIREKLTQANFVKCNLADHRRKLRKFNRFMNTFVNTDVFWMKSFYRKHIASLDETPVLETWWKFVKEYLVFVDPASVVFDWPKYEDHRSFNTVTKGTDFSQWLDLYRNFNVDWI